MNTGTAEADPRRGDAPSSAGTRTAAADAPAVLRAEGVSVTLGGAKVLDDVSFTVDRGEVVALMGANGSGKSTLVRAVLDLVPHTGSVRLFDTDQRRFGQWHRVGYVPQRSSPALQAATVREVVSSGRLAHRRPLWPASRTDRRIITDAIDRMGLAELAGRELGHLSGGQQQRALIARALTSEPELMVLDEPLAGIDVPTQQGLAATMAELAGDGMAMLVVLHELGSFEPLLDRTVCLDHGRVSYDGAPGCESDHHGHDAPHEHPADHVHAHGRHETEEAPERPRLLDDPVNSDPEADQ